MTTHPFRPWRRRLVAGLAAMALTLGIVGCSVTGTTDPAGGTPATTGGATVSTATGFSDNVESHADADDAGYDEAETTTIDLADGSTSVSGQDEDGVEVDGGHVLISEPGTYVVSGTLTDGQLEIDSEADGKVRIVLDDASLTSTTGSPFVVTEADEVVLVLADGTVNDLTDGTGYDDDADAAPNAALFSMADLTIGGTGELHVTGNTNDGIATKDGLAILSGTVTVTAVDDGIRGKDYVDVTGGTVTVEAEDDAIKSDNEDDDTVGWVRISDGTVTITAGDDGIHAEGDLEIAGGTVTVAESVEGLEGVTVTVSGGVVDITSSDDGLNATAGSTTDESGDESGRGAGPGGGGGGMANDGSVLTISGGELTVDAEGDGLDSNGDLIVTDGVTVINGPTSNGNGALDANGTMTVDGGTLVASGSSGMAESPAAGEAGWLAVAFDSTLEAGTTVVVLDGDTVIGSFTSTKAADSLVLSVDGITEGQTYTIATISDDRTAGWADGGSADGTTTLTEVTASEAIAGGMGGGPGGDRQPR